LQLRAALGLALSCKRYYSMVMAEARHKLMPPHARPDEGLRLSKAQVKSAPVEQLRAWAQQAQIDRAAPKKRRSTPQPAPTVARLRQLVQAECCSTLPRWERRLFRGELAVHPARMMLLLWPQQPAVFWQLLSASCGATTNGLSSSTR
jgi:hypothetical protein